MISRAASRSAWRTMIRMRDRMFVTMSKDSMPVASMPSDSRRDSSRGPWARGTSAASTRASGSWSTGAPACRRRRNRSRRPMATSLAALALSLVVAACGGGGDEGGQGRGAAPTPTSTTAATTTTAAPTTTTTAPVDPATLRPPAPVGDPAALAERIGTAEATLRNPASGPNDIATAALAQQAAYRQLGDHPEWDATVLAALPAELQGAVQGHAAPRREFRALARGPAVTMPAWRIVPPAPADQLVAWYHEAEAAYGVPWQVLAAVNLVETDMGRIQGTSTAGAQGPMQF